MVASAGIYARWCPPLDRYVQCGVAGQKVISVSFPREEDPNAATDFSLLDRIEAYLAGETDDFEDVEVGITVPTDQRSVLETVRSIPHGETASVEQVTRMTPGLNGAEEDDRHTVTEALATNPVPVLVPCHRVADGPSGAPADVARTLRDIEG